MGLFSNFYELTGSLAAFLHSSGVPTDHPPPQVLTDWTSR